MPITDTKIACFELSPHALGSIRVLVTDDPAGHTEPATDATGPWYPARRNTPGMRTATIMDITYVAGNRRTRYYLTTDIGPVNNLAHNRSFFIAPAAPTPAPTLPPVTASRVAPSHYHVYTTVVTVGLTFVAHGETYIVVGEPIAAGYRSYWARTREVGGRHDGNEFSAFLTLRP